MKLAFTTLGCPQWDLDTIIARAIEYGYDGVDFRGYRGELKLYELPEFTTGVVATARRFADAGLEVPCFSSSVRAFCPTAEALETAIEEVRCYAQICGHFGTPFIRVFGGGIGDTPREQAIDMVVSSLEKLQAAVRDWPVQLLIETHDDWTDSRHLGPVMERLDGGAVGILWDTHHPYRAVGEDPAATWQLLGKWIRNTHWKDSYLAAAVRRGHQLCLVGDGDLPLQEIYTCLHHNGYDGYLTLEWEKMWCPEIPEPEQAFPRYVEHMRGLMAER